MGDAEGGGVGNLPLGGKGPEEYRVELPVRENLGVPDLVAAGEDHVIGKLRCPQLRQALIVMRGNAQSGAGKLLKPLIPGLQWPVVQGRMDVMGGGPNACGALEEAVVLVDIIVNDLTFAPQALYSLLRGAGLEQRTVMMDMIKGHKSCFQG